MGRSKHSLSKKDPLYARIHSRKQYLKRLREGRCVNCGKPAEEGFAHCPGCRVRIAERHKAWAAKHRPAHDHREWSTPSEKMDWLRAYPGFLDDLNVGLYQYEIEFRDLARKAREAGLYARNTKVMVVADSLLKYSRLILANDAVRARHRLRKPPRAE